MSIEDMIIRLHIGDLRRKGHTIQVRPKANFVEHVQSSKFKKANNKAKGSKLGPKGGTSKKQKLQRKCFNGGKQG